MTPVRVFHVINSLGFGGAERQLSTIFPALSQMGAEQRVISLVNTRSGVYIPQHALVSGQGRSQIIAAMLQAVRAAKDPDNVLVAWMYHSWLVVLIAHVFTGRRGRIFFYCRHGSPETLRPSTRLLASAMLRIAKAMRIPVVFNSRAGLAMHQNLVPGVDGVLISNAVGDSAVRKSTRSKVIAFLGRNHRDKGADRVGDIACRLLGRLPSSWRFVVAGPGMPERRTEIMDAFMASGVDPGRLLVQGAVDDVQMFMLAADLLVLPSRTESFPNVLAEAMMTGVPVAAMDVGGVRDLLDGLISPSNDIDALVEKGAAICLMNDDDYFELSRSLRCAVECRHGIFEIARQHVDLWRSRV